MKNYASNGSINHSRSKMPPTWLQHAFKMLARGLTWLKNAYKSSNLVPKMPPRCPQEAPGCPKLPPRCPKMAPRCLKMPPRCPQGGSRWPPDAPKRPQDAPKCTQDATMKAPRCRKMVSRGPQMPQDASRSLPNGPLGSILDDFLMDFYCFLSIFHRFF